MRNKMQNIEVISSHLSPLNIPGMIAARNETAAIVSDTLNIERYVERDIINEYSAELLSDAAIELHKLSAPHSKHSPDDFFHFIAEAEDEEFAGIVEIEDPWAPRDYLLEQAQQILGYSRADTLKRYRATVEDFQEYMLRSQERLEAPKTKDNRPKAFHLIDSALTKVTGSIDTQTLKQKVGSLVKASNLSNDVQASNYLIEKLATHKHIHLGKRDAAKLVNTTISEYKAANRPQKKKEKGRAHITLSDHRADSDAVYKWMKNQGDDPRIFHNGGRMTEVLEDESGNIRISPIDKPRFKGAHLEDRIDFWNEGSNGNIQNIPAPDPLVNRVYQMPLAGYPPLFRITNFPTYSAELALVMDSGYHADSGLYHKPKAGVFIPKVSKAPTPEEVAAARCGLADLLADFPLDGMTRTELEIAIENGDPVPSFCHALSVAMTPVCRDMIGGPTPNHLGRKDKPRTGATLLMSAMSCIGTLEPAAPQSLPDSRSEVQKTLTAIIDSGAPYAFMDNLPEGETTESDELAGAMTAFPDYTGRRLGETSMIKARVTQTWLSTGNRTQLSEQLRERTLLIDLDPKMERPGERPTASFKYSPLVPHIQKNAGRYMHNILVLVQNWIAKGCPEWQGQALGGFEAHARVIGGILDAAGIHGFMGNRDKLRARMAIAENPETELLDAMIEAHHSAPTLFRVWSNEAPPEKVKDKSGEMVAFQYAGCRVLSIRDLLTLEQIAPKKWGYDYEDGDVIYPSKAKAKVTYHFGAMEGTVREWREAHTERVSQQGRYVLAKVHKDKHGTLYRLEHLPLIN